jgi:hypothetical protein
MKTRFMIAALLCLLLAGPAVAQKWDTVAVAEVPFDFVVGDQTLPAGNYIVRTYDQHTMMIQNTTTQRSGMINNNDILLKSGADHQSTRLVFALNNGQQVLHQIAIAGDDHTHDVMHRADIVELTPSR